MPNVFTPEVIQQFTNEAPELKSYIQRVELTLEPTLDPPFNYLVRAIIYQQLSGRAAATIFNRFSKLVGPLSASSILKHSQEELRGVGLSRQKAAYVHNVANSFQKGGELAEFKTSMDTEKLSSREIIDLFTAIKGVGEWTVQMYLIFGLGRLDVLAAKDLGIQKGVQLMYDLEALPKPAEVRRTVGHWKSYPTVGTILCWRVLDTELPE